MQADQNGVHVGKDGWLFLVAGSNEALRLLTDSEWFVREDARNWALKLADREKRLSTLGAQYFHMWVPDKIKVYQDQLNFDNGILKVDPPGMVIEFARDLGLERVIVNPLPAFMAAKTTSFFTGRRIHIGLTRARALRTKHCVMPSMPFRPMICGIGPSTPPRWPSI